LPDIALPGVSPFLELVSWAAEKGMVKSRTASQNTARE
jgi:hypothetical protein